MKIIVHPKSSRAPVFFVAVVIALSAAAASHAQTTQPQKTPSKNEPARPDKAIDAAKKAIEAAEKADGPEHPSVAKCLEILAVEQ